MENPGSNACFHWRDSQGRPLTVPIDRKVSVDAGRSDLRSPEGTRLGLRSPMDGMEDQPPRFVAPSMKGIRA